MSGVPPLPRPAGQTVRQDFVGGPEADQNEAGLPESPSLVGKADVVCDDVAGRKTPQEIADPDPGIERPTDVCPELLGAATGVGLLSEEGGGLGGELGPNGQRRVGVQLFGPLHQVAMPLIGVLGCPADDLL